MASTDAVTPRVLSNLESSAHEVMSVGCLSEPAK